MFTRKTFILHWFYKIVETKTRKEKRHNNNGNDVYDETIDICDHCVCNDIGHRTKLKTICPFSNSIINDRRIQNMYMYVLMVSFAKSILVADRLPLLRHINMKHTTLVIKATI